MWSYQAQFCHGTCRPMCLLSGAFETPSLIRFSDLTVTSSSHQNHKHQVVCGHSISVCPRVTSLLCDMSDKIIVRKSKKIMGLSEIRQPWKQTLSHWLAHQFSTPKLRFLQKAHLGERSRWSQPSSQPSIHTWLSWANSYLQSCFSGLMGTWFNGVLVAIP